LSAAMPPWAAATYTYWGPELVGIDDNGLLGNELLRRQAAVVREAVPWFADHPPATGTDH